MQQELPMFLCLLLLLLSIISVFAMEDENMKLLKPTPFQKLHYTDYPVLYASNNALQPLTNNLDTPPIALDEFSNIFNAILKDHPEWASKFNNPAFYQQVQSFYNQLKNSSCRNLDEIEKLVPHIPKSEASTNAE